MFDITTVLLIGVFLRLGYWLLKKPIKRPNGPSMWELLKFTYTKDIKIEDVVLEWTRTYKDIMCVKRIGKEPHYFISDFELLKEVFIQNADIFSNRPTNMWLINRLTKKKGVTFNDNSWKETRRFAMRSMRDFGLGKHSLEERIRNEARSLVKQFLAYDENAFDPKQDITIAVSNIICAITFGKRYERDDTDFTAALENLDKFFKSRFTTSPLNNLPFLRHFGFLHKLLDVESYERITLDIRRFVSGEIRQHRETYDPGNIRDLVDLYLQAEHNGFQDIRGMDEENLFQTILDLFLAGTDTTSGTLRWILLRLVNNPDVQRKCQEEIHRVIGKDKLPEYRERNDFPYTVATIHEAVRMDTIGFGTLAHVADKSMEIGGFLITQGSQVNGLTRGLMYDEKIWGGDANTFRPERWLNEEGQVRSVPEFLPFGLGRRACPGEQLARTELFIDTVALLQSFTFKAEHPDSPPTIEGTCGVTYIPKPFQLVAMPL